MEYADGSQYNITAAERLLASLGATKYADFRMMRAVYRNWPSILLGTALHTNVKRELRVPEYMEIDRKRSVVRINKSGKQVLFHFKPEQLSDSLYTLIETFGEEQYSTLDVSGKDVLDIGANIGDTAVYFSLNGARHVYSYEPFPYTYSLAKENVRLNRVSGTVSLFNEGCADRTYRIRLNSGVQNLSSRIAQSSNGKTITVRSLKEVVNKHRIRGGVLKADCEGSEYPLILTADNDTLRRFDEIVIEYHYGYRNLERKLRGAGFTVAHSWPRPVVFDRKMIIGMLHAKKSDSSP